MGVIKAKMSNLNSRDFLESKHRQYYDMSDLWKFWEDSWIGGQHYLDSGYLKKHYREEPSAYDYRKSISKYENHGENIGSDWVSRLFGPGFTASLQSEESISPQAAEWTQDFDLLGTDMVSFLAEVAQTVVALGSAGVVCNVFNPLESAAVSLRQAEEMGVRPFARMVKPQNIVNWDWDRFGLLKWVLIREPTFIDLPIESYVNSQAHRNLMNYDQYYRYHFIDKTHFVTFEPVADSSTWREIPVEHGLGYLPFQMAHWMRPRPRVMFSRSPLEDVYHFAELIFNLSSGLNDLVQSQMFSIFIVAGRQGRKKDGEKEPSVPVAPTRGLTVDGNQGFPPFFASPDASLPKVHQELVAGYQRTIQRIARRGAQSLVDDGKAREASGRAKAFDIDMLTAFLRKAGDNMERSFTNILTTFWDRSILSSKKFSGTVKFPDDFHLRGSIELAEETLAMQQAIMESPKAQAIIKRRFAKSALRSDATEEEMKEILQELVEADFSPYTVEELQSMTIGSSQPDQPGSERVVKQNERRNDRRSVPGANPTREQPGPTLVRTSPR